KIVRYMAQSIIETNGKKYHLFARPNSRAKNKVWWYWFWGYELQTKNGKEDLAMVRKRESTGKKIKTEAIEYLKKLAGGTGDTLQEYAEARQFFIRGKCPYIRHKDLKNGISDTTISEHIYDLHRRVLPALGG
ncbi:unnamed protein product, partial [marine sediment metagenome]